MCNRSFLRRQALPFALLLLLGSALLPLSAAAQEGPFTDSVLPAASKVVRDVAYGAAPRQRMDVYLPAHPDHAPVIFMVHGGAWRVGDKGAANVVDNKVARWVSRGFIFISTNYRLLPDAMPLEQAQDVARALASAQAHATAWGGDPAKFILMGHSAGAHLVALLAAAPEQAYQLGAKPWLGTVLLDSAALDVVHLMEQSHYRLYDRAFGKDASYWRRVSPYAQLSGAATPMLVVCSTRRDDSCRQAEQFVAKANRMQVRASVLQEDLSHRSINQQLGSAGSYTDAVESFLASLDPAVAQRLAAAAQR